MTERGFDTESRNFWNIDHVITNEAVLLFGWKFTSGAWNISSSIHTSTVFALSWMRQNGDTEPGVIQRSERRSSGLAKLNLFSSSFFARLSSRTRFAHATITRKYRVFFSFLRKRFFHAIHGMWEHIWSASSTRYTRGCSWRTPSTPFSLR